MKYILYIDTNSKDQRVHELAEIARGAGWRVADFGQVKQGFAEKLDAGRGGQVFGAKEQGFGGKDLVAWHSDEVSVKEAREDGQPIYFLAPRFIPDFDFPGNSFVFGYGKFDLKNYMECREAGRTVEVDSESVDKSFESVVASDKSSTRWPEQMEVDSWKSVKGAAGLVGASYYCLSDDEAFVQENNYLTALAQKELLVKRFGSANMKMLIIGYGKLTVQLERVLCDADIHILQFNHSKVDTVREKYGDKAYFEDAPIHEFPVIINTVPKQVVKIERPIDSVIYELASPPYGFDFGKHDMSKIDYNIEAALPGRFYPKQAAQAVFDCIKRKLGEKKTIVLCMTASSCCFERVMPVVESLCEKYNIVPVMSENALKPNRFLDIEEFKRRLRELCGNNIITTIAGSETLSSRKDVVGSAVVPATGNTIAKLASAVTDTPVTMAVKALLRNGKPCVLGISTNDALSGNAANIGLLLNRKNYFFVPFGQDDFVNKPFSMVCDFKKVGEAIEAALQGKQIQPIIL